MNRSAGSAYGLPHPTTISAATSVFGITPFGIFCRRCGCPVGLSRRSLTRHVTEHHKRLALELSFSSSRWFLELHQGFQALQALPDKTGYTKGTLVGSVCSCGEVFACPKTAKQHVHLKNSKGILELHVLSSCTLVRTVCSRVMPLAACMKRKPTTPVRQEISYSDTMRVLSPYVRADEMVADYVPIIHCITKDGGNFNSVMSSLVERWQSPVTENALAGLIEVAKAWLLERARYDVGVVPGNLKAALLVFEGQDIADVKQNYTFQFRHKESLLWRELEKLIKFIYRSGAGGGHFFQVLTGEMKVPAGLVRTLLEKPHALGDPSVAVLYCISRLFRTGKDGLTMISCADGASIASSVLSILRTAVCSYLVMNPSTTTEDAEKMVSNVRVSTTLNTICPMIRKLREMQAKKPTKRLCTVDEDGTICIDDFCFPKRCWSKLFSVFESTCRALFSKMFISGDYVTILESPCLDCVCTEGDWSSLSFSANGVHSSQLAVNQDFNLFYLDRLSSYVELSFHGFGGGSMRKEELDRLGRDHLRWHRGTIYYSSSSLKKFSHRSSTGSTVDRKLPTVAARTYLLYLTICKNRDFKENFVVPWTQQRNHSLNDAVAEIFSFSKTPSAIQVRHLWTSIQNYVFPDSTAFLQTVSATATVAGLSSHTSTTHRSIYGSQVVNGREYVYSKYHHAIGAWDSAAPTCSGLQVADLAVGLKHLFGEGASYRSSEQQLLCETCLPGLLSQHCFVGVQCGGGKSLAWLLPSVSCLLLGKERKTTIVVLPYRFLAIFHCEAARALSSAQCELQCSLLLGKDVSQEVMPGCLEQDECLPDLIFASLDAFVSLVCHHGRRIQELVRAKLMGNVILDEVHTCLTEDSFRSCYDNLFHVSSLGMPVLCMSGSMPTDFILPMMRKLNLCSQDTSSYLNISGGTIWGEYPEGFLISKESVPPSALLTKALSVLTADLGNLPTHSVHVIVSTKALGESLLLQLNGSYRASFINAETSESEQTRVSQLWKGGQLDVLITTTLGLVGNESDRCTRVLIVGYLYSLVSVVQAIGRLRGGQRRADGWIKVLFPHISSYQLDLWKRQAAQGNDTFKERFKLDKGSQQFGLTLTTLSVYHWCQFVGGCLLSYISEAMGMQRMVCRVCTHCRSSPVQLSQQRFLHLESSNISKLCSFNKVISMLKFQCLVCRDSKCEGDTCLKGCYVCGGDHYRNKCIVRVEKLLKDKVCYHCLDLKCRRNYEFHRFNECPLKRRLKRLLIHSWSIKKEGRSYECFLSTVYSSEETFVKFLSALDK